MAQQDDKHNIEFLNELLREWAQNMWVKNNPDKITDKWGGSENFTKVWLDGHERWVTGKERASEMGFGAYIKTAVFTVGLVSEKAVEALADNKLVNAWRKSVQKNNFQKRYNLLEEILADTIKKRGTAAATADFPKLNVASPDEVAAALEYINYNAKYYPVSTVAGLIRASNRTPEALAQSPRGPKAA